MLCYRCEERAKYLEKLSKVSPEEKYKTDFHLPSSRYECGDIESSVMGCYMFKPTKPITIKPRNNDDRPLSLNMLSCRVERTNEDIDMELDVIKTDRGILPYWKPKE